jgi:peroxiredoxin
MRSKSVLIGLFLLVLLLLSLSEAKAQKKVDLVGRDTLNFTLPSTHDRIITYAEEYYGKHHLVITFFPAAYTPV